MNILYFLRDNLPTFRVDILCLFGKYLPRIQINSSIVGQMAEGDPQPVGWGGGFVYTFRSPKAPRVIRQIYAFFSHVCILIDKGKFYDAIQVRNQYLFGLVALIAARILDKPFFFWFSFPYPEDDLLRVKVHGASLGNFRMMFVFLRGCLSKLILYQILLRKADHIFVQSDRMLDDMVARGLNKETMTVVPMCVDFEMFNNIKLTPKRHKSHKDGKILVYLGSLNRVRNINFLIDSFVKVLEKKPKTYFLMVGDASEKQDSKWLKNIIISKQLQDKIFITGWLPMKNAWEFTMGADIGICAIPEGFTFDSMSPTKAVEYMALGLPVVVNRQPDQEKIIKESGGGLCVELDENKFSDAIIRILQDEHIARQMAEKGKSYVLAMRNYTAMASKVASVYQSFKRV